MAKAFLKLVADHIFHHYEDTVENLCVVLPNKRGALFLKQHLSASFGKTIWLPAIISAEELVTELSGLKTLEEIDLVCHLYESYKACYGNDAEPFDSFAKWGQLILQDFNEIDRYLADPEQLYENLKDIKVIENWSLGEATLTENQQNYLRFMSSLGAIYKHFTNFLLSRGWAYQGLAYRQAANAIQEAGYPSRFSKMLICGFNALNASEIRIFSHLLQQNKAELIWDADHYYLDDHNQEAGMFLRKNLSRFGNREAIFTGTYFKTQKNIHIVAVPKQTGQAQVVKQKLQALIDQEVQMSRVAVVLANEKLLWPVLQQLPSAVERVNITMEYPLRYTASYGLAESLIQLQVAFSRQQRKHKTIYHKDLVSLLRQPVLQDYVKTKAPALYLPGVISRLTSRNISFVTTRHLEELFEDHLPAMSHFLTPAKSIQALCEHLSDLFSTGIAYHAQNKGSVQSLELEYQYILLRNFKRLHEIITRYPHFNDVAAFRQLFTQVVGNSSAPFIGEPLEGLQIMGVLETRTLDFDHVIFVSVNEGVLPSGKTINSFIPNDLKSAFGLPLYLEKDAVYAYHFYRLLQRAKTADIIFDSETDTFGKGEKSRFVTQLQLELKKYNPEITVTESVATYPDFPAMLPHPVHLEKTARLIEPIVAKATSQEQFGGLSPSGLAVFKECSLKFYFRYGVHLKETEEIEESAEASTFGSILHLSLENLYKNHTGKVLQAGMLAEALERADTEVKNAFKSFFDDMEPTGKALLQQEVITVYVKKLLNNDLRFVKLLEKDQQHLSILYLEKEFSAPLEIETEGRNQVIYVKGKIDRVDSCAGTVRVIDYKSSVKDSDRFVFEGFGPLFHDKSYDKQLQLMIYAWLLFRNNIAVPGALRPCIVPFKVFSEEPRYMTGSDKKPLVFSADLLMQFEQELKSFIQQIFSTRLPFTQTADRKVCEFCAYSTICNFHP